MPQIPRSWEYSDIDKQLLPAYFEWVMRILGDHKSRYSNKTITVSPTIAGVPSKPIRIPLYKALKGYYISDDVNMGTVDRYGDMLMIYASLVAIAKLGVSNSLKLAVSPSIDMTTFGLNRTVNDHVTGFGYIVESSVDIIAVHEGRGYGHAAYYWPTQATQPVQTLDPQLDKIIKKINPNWKTNGTFQDWFTGSVHEVTLFMFSSLTILLFRTRETLLSISNTFQLFQKLGSKAAELRKQYSSLELWLGLEAFDDLNNDPCLPLRGMATVRDTVNKQRLDFALAQGAAGVRKVVAFSWDPDFTCTTHKHNITLSEQIVQDAKRSIIFECRFHSSQNRSVVAIGINVMGSGFHVSTNQQNYL